MSEETIQIIASNLAVAYFTGHERQRPTDQDSRAGIASMVAAQNAPFESVIQVFERFRTYLKETQTDGSKGT